jgi:hypothetical protein
VGSTSSSVHRPLVEGKQWRINVRSWAESCRLHELEDSEHFKIVRLNASADVRAFAKMCHDLVLDRPASFTLRHRIELYRRWLTGEQPCLLATHDGQGRIAAVSIVLPLTPNAFRAFWSEGLDASGTMRPRAGENHGTGRSPGPGR